jgi:hypothetical protein
MAEPASLGELMSDDFVLVREGDDDPLGLELGQTGQVSAVAIDGEGRISRAWSGGNGGMAIIAWADTPVADIAGSSTLHRELIRGNAAIVVLLRDRPAGIISAERFTTYLATHRDLPATKSGDTAAGDSLLAGCYTQSLLVVICNVCGERNELRSWVEGVTRCANTAPPLHVLVRRQ